MINLGRITAKRTAARSRWHGAMALEAYDIRRSGSHCLRVEPSRARARQRLNVGQSLIETLAGFIILIPLGLFSYDLTYILIANQSNEKLADNAARVAANHADNLGAQQAAQQAIDSFQQSANYGPVTLTDFEFNIGGSGQVSLITQIDMKLPVAFGSWKSMTINAKGVQPIVGIPASI